MRLVKLNMHHRWDQRGLDKRSCTGGFCLGRWTMMCNKEMSSNCR